MAQNMNFNFKGTGKEVADQVSSLQDLLQMVVTNYSHEENWFISVSGTLNGESTGLRSTLFNVLASLVKQLREEDDAESDIDEHDITIYIEPVDKPADFVDAEPEY